MWCRERGSLSSLDQPNAEMRPSESTVVSQVSLQKVAGTGSPVCLPLVCAVPVLWTFRFCWLKSFSQWKNTHWVEGVVTSRLCLVCDSSTVVAERRFWNRVGRRGSHLTICRSAQQTDQ